MRSQHPRDGARARDRRGVSFDERAPSKSQTLNVAPARAGGYPVSRPAEIAARARPSGAGTDARARRGRTRGVDRARPAASRAPRRGVSFRRRSPIPQLPEGSTGWRPGRRRVIGFRPSRIRRRGRGRAHARARVARGPRRPTRPPRARRAPRARRRRRRRSRAGVLGADGLHHPRRSQKRGQYVHFERRSVQRGEHVGRQSAHELEWGVSGL